jgi:hypothetical protein
MAAPNTRNVSAAQPKVGGGVYWAPLGTALPTDASTALVAGYTPLGYVSDAGITPSRDTSIDKPKAWGGDTVAALQTDESLSYEWTLIEAFSGDVRKFVHGAANVTITAAVSGTGEKLAILDKGGKPANCVLVFDMKYGAKVRRVVLPVADNVVSAEAPYSDSDLSGFTITTEALKDTSGVRMYEFTTNDNALP